MAKYDWEKLRQKFVTTGAKCSLKQFAIDNKVPYGLLRQNAKGWTTQKRTKTEQKTNKVIEKTIDRQIDSEVEMNLRHYEISRKLLDSVEKSAGTKELYLMPKSINSLAKSLETLQKVQRIASGLDKSDNKGDVIQNFMEAVINGSNEDTNQ